MEPNIIKFANMGFDQIDKENTAKKKKFPKKKKKSPEDEGWLWKAMQKRKAEGTKMRATVFE